MCWGEPRHLKAPLTIIASLVQRASHSSILQNKSRGKNQIISSENREHFLYLNLVKVEESEQMQNRYTKPLASKGDSQSYNPNQYVPKAVTT